MTARQLRPGATASFPLAILVHLLFGCGPRVESLVILEPEQRLLRSLEKRIALTAVAKDASGEVIVAPDLRWTSSAPEVAVVENGLVTARKSGKVVVSVSAGNQSASTTFLVSIPASLELRPGNLEIVGLGRSTVVDASVKDELGKAIRDATISWTSSDEGIAREEAGSIVAVGQGVAVLTASVDGVSRRLEVRVIRGDIARLSIQPSRHVFSGPGQTLQFQAKAFDAKGAAINGVPVSWNLSGAGVAKVDSTGLLTATGSGKTLLSASAGKRRAAAEIVVK